MNQHPRGQVGNREVQDHKEDENKLEAEHESSLEPQGHLVCSILHEKAVGILPALATGQRELPWVLKYTGL